jgi:hypothetical protein
MVSHSQVMSSHHRLSYLLIKEQLVKPASNAKKQNPRWNEPAGVLLSILENISVTRFYLL